MAAARVKQVLKQYGKVALVFHSSVFVSTFAATYGAIHYGVDVRKQLDRVPFVDASRIDPEAGTVAIAYLATIATGPARGALTVTAAPLIARSLGRAAACAAKK